jgi:hypothetical protein
LPELYPTIDVLDKPCARVELYWPGGSRGEFIVDMLRSDPNYYCLSALAKASSYGVQQEYAATAFNYSS